VRTALACLISILQFLAPRFRTEDQRDAHDQDGQCQCANSHSRLDTHLLSSVDVPTACTNSMSDACSSSALIHRTNAFHPLNCTRAMDQPPPCDIRNAGMPLGNGDTTVLAFPLVSMPPPAPPPPKPCSDPSKFIGGYCNYGKFIGCHDSSCQVLINGTTEGKCTSKTHAGCVAEVAAVCTAHASNGCAAFSVLNIPPFFNYEIFRKGDATSNPKPDDDWDFWTLPEDVPPSAVSNFSLHDGLSFFVGMQTAMASDTALFKLGMVRVTPHLDSHGG
jgi:hypothetical protein